tara:strand:- start:1423 stop:2043 length:621 start_codon:yes stop_codon:yes gene_type:complete
MEELLLPIFTAIIGVAGTLLALWYKHKLDLKKSLLIEENCVVAECVREDSAVVNKLKDVLSETNADRICIFSFHNGGYFYSGKSMQKMSMSYEVVDNGVSSIQLEKQNIPVSACTTTLGPLMEHGEFFNVNTKEYPEGLCKYHLLQDGVKSTYYWVIIDIQNKAIGVVRLDFVKRKTKLSSEDQNLMEELSKQLPGYLIRQNKLRE